MNLIFLEEAVVEMVESARFYEAKSEGLGSDFLTAVEGTTGRILQSPQPPHSNKVIFGSGLCRVFHSASFMSHTRIGFSWRPLCTNDAGPATGGKDCIDNFSLEVRMIKKVFAHANRGILLDVIVFFVNVILLTILSRQLDNLFHQANTRDASAVARAAVAIFCLGLVFLQPIGAILKRRRAHSRKPDLHNVPAGCLILPAYFLTQLIFLIGASGQIVDMVYGRTSSSGSSDYFGLPPQVFMLLFLGIPALAIGNTFVVYFYFQQPTHKPIVPWLETPRSEAFGDVFLFLNMIGFQAFWGLLMSSLVEDHSTIVGRLSMFAFITLLIYIPPRLFYLAEDGKRPIVWLTMLLANLPALLRILFVSATKAMNWQ
jgi:hypothetical protein